MSKDIQEERFNVVACFSRKGEVNCWVMYDGFAYDEALEFRRLGLEQHGHKSYFIGFYIVPAIENEPIEDNCLNRLDIDLETLTLDKINPGYVPKGLFYILNYQMKGEIFMFQNTGKLIFDSVEDKTSAKGNPYRIVHIIDPVDYQRLEYFADSNLKVTCAPNEECTLVLKATRQGYSTNMTAMAVNKK